MNPLKINLSLPFNGVCVGLLLFMLGNNFLTNLGSDLIKSLLCSVGLVITIISLIRFKDFVYPLKGAQSLLYNLFILLTLLLIVRGYMIDYNYQWVNVYGLINYHFFSNVYILPYFLPFTILFSKYVNFNVFIKINIVLNIIFILLFIYNYQTLLQSSHLQLEVMDEEASQSEITLPASIVVFYTTTGFVVLLKDYLSRPVWLLNVINLILAIFTQSIGGRRGGSFILIVLGVFSAIIYITSLRGKSKFFGFFLVALMICILGSIFVIYQDSVFAFILTRGLEDNRSGVDDALLNQMSTFELWLGKGLNGRYYYPILSNDYLKGWRYGSETGFYNLVLKGGYVYSYLYIILMLIPALKGLFFSNNTFTKALGLYIILSLIELYPFGWFTFNIKFLVIWISVPICSSLSLRNKNNEEIKNLYFK